MMQINDDYYEDLTPETTVALLKAFQAAAEATGMGGGTPGLAGEAGKGDGEGGVKGTDRDHKTGNEVRGQGRSYSAGGVRVPTPGPLSGRVSCEPKGGLTSLTSEPWGTEMLRKDGAL